MMSKLGEIIRLLRLKEGLSQEELSQIAKVSRIFFR